MSRYKKNNPRLDVKFINGDTEETILEINDRTWMNVGELFSDHIVNNLIQQEIKDNDPPDNIIVLVMGEYSLTI